MTTFIAATLLQSTALLALGAAYDSPTGTTVEHGGMLYQRGDLIRYMEPHLGDPTGVRVIDRSLLQPGDILLATYHVHLCLAGYYHDLFSKQDVVAAFFTGIPEFMLDECTGEVHEFYSKEDKIRDTGRDVHIFGTKCEDVLIHLPAGRIVGNIGETQTERPLVIDIDRERCK